MPSIRSRARACTSLMDSARTSMRPSEGPCAALSFVGVQCFRKARSRPKEEDNSFMRNLGFTRSSYQRDHMLLTPDTFVRAPLPGMEKCTAIVHAAPAVGARFTEYTAEFEASGKLKPSAANRFVYVVEGELNIGGPGSYAYEAVEVAARTAARAVVIEKEYVPHAQAGRPALLVSHERDAPT